MTAQIVNLQDWRRQRDERKAGRLSLHTDDYYALVRRLMVEHYALIRRLAVEQIEARTDCGDSSTWPWV